MENHLEVGFSMQCFLDRFFINGHDCCCFHLAFWLFALMTSIVLSLVLVVSFIILVLQWLAQWEFFGLLTFPRYLHFFLDALSWFDPLCLYPSDLPSRFNNLPSWFDTLPFWLYPHLMSYLILFYLTFFRSPVFSCCYFFVIWHQLHL